jgi:hypothetical protein
MAIKYYGTSTTATGYKVSESKDVRIVRAMWLSGWYAIIKQSTVTTVTHYEGLSEASLTDLKAMAVESSTLSGTERAYLGGATVTRSSGGVSSWMHCDDCWGTRVSVSARRMSPHMWAADVTTEVMDVSTDTASGTLEKT